MSKSNNLNQLFPLLKCSTSNKIKLPATSFTKTQLIKHASIMEDRFSQFQQTQTNHVEKKKQTHSYINI